MAIQSRSRTYEDLKQERETRDERYRHLRYYSRIVGRSEGTFCPSPRPLISGA
jgi:hypothetical protein